MNDISSQWPFRFTITYTEDEQRIFRKVMAARLARLARVRNEGTAFAIMLAGILAFGLAVIGAYRLDWIENSAIRPVLFTAYFAFVAGAGSYYFAMRHHFRKFYRENTRTRWDFLFDDAGVAYKSETMEVRMVWRGLDSVEDWGRVVLLLFNRRGIGIPPRVFVDGAARAAFVTEVAARIKAATETAHA